jgi:hypothetical protein
VLAAGGLPAGAGVVWAGAASSARTAVDKTKAAPAHINVPYSAKWRLKITLNNPFQKASELRRSES